MATVMAMAHTVAVNLSGTLDSSKHCLNSKFHILRYKFESQKCSSIPLQQRAKFSFFDKFAGTCNVINVIFHYITTSDQHTWFRNQARINARLQGPCCCCEAMPIPQGNIRWGMGWGQVVDESLISVSGKWLLHMDVSKNRGTPKWMVYNS